jgi:hypothetical protein
MHEMRGGVRGQVWACTESGLYQRYLRIVKELAKCRDDNQINLLQAHLQNILNRNLIPSQLLEPRFVKRYTTGNATLHLHGFASIKPSGRDRVEFCAILDSSNARVFSAQGADLFAQVESCFGQIQVSVFVSIREFSDDTENITNRGTAIRLTTLDECKRPFGNPWQLTGEAVVGSGFLGRIGPQWEKAVLLPISGELDVARIQLDEIESQVIKGGTNLVDRLARQDRNLERRGLAHADFFFAIRLQGSLVRVTCGVAGNVLSYGFNMFRCPDEFEVRSVNAVEH